MKKITLLAVVLVATSALALQQLDLNLSARLQHFITGTLIGPRSLFATDAKINASRVTRSLGANATIDFASVTTTCVDSSAVTVTGARAGDACSVGAPAAATANLSFTCYVSATDAVKVRACAAGTAADAASATYYVRVISSQ